MAKFYGAIGYGEAVETAPQIFEEKITERFYYGDVIRNMRKMDNGEYLHEEINVNNSISIVSDAYADHHFFAIRYVTWMGTRWKVSTVEVVPPRLILSIGGVYNGPTAEPGA